MNKRISAKEIAEIAHRGQFRKDGITPYITHPEAVASFFGDDRLKDIAWLHDVVEDTCISLEQLSILGIPNDILNVVERLTRAKGEKYLNYILSIKYNDEARMVKIQDILHNYGDNPSSRQKERYEMALYILNN